MYDILEKEKYTWLKYYLKSDIPCINLNYMHYIYHSITPYYCTIVRHFSIQVCIHMYICA